MDMARMGLISKISDEIIGFKQQQLNPLKMYFFQLKSSFMFLTIF